RRARRARRPRRSAGQVVAGVPVRRARTTGRSAQHRRPDGRRREPQTTQRPPRLAREHPRRPRRRPPVIQVVDASVVVAALVDDSPTGRWCEDAIQHGDLAAPHLMPFEASNIIRRLVTHGELDASAGALAVDDLRRLPVDLAPYELLAARIWELRDNLTSYDAA